MPGIPTVIDNKALIHNSSFDPDIIGPVVPSSTDVHRVLVLKKSRRAYETIASCLYKEGAIPVICRKVLEALKEIWNDQRPLGQYQFDDSGNLYSYTT